MCNEIELKPQTNVSLKNCMDAHCIYIYRPYTVTIFRPKIPKEHAFREGRIEGEGGCRSSPQAPVYLTQALEVIMIVYNCLHMKNSRFALHENSPNNHPTPLN